MELFDMENLHLHIQELTRVSKQGKLVFFAGAGLSVLSGYPKWETLIDEFCNELFDETNKEVCSASDYLRISQIYYDIKGEEEYNRILERVFSTDRELNQIHYKMLAMNPAHIITTNYDDLIENACYHRGKFFSVISAEEDIAKATSSKYLVKVHGDFRRGYKSKNIVLKENDYLNYENNFPLISNLVRTIMATHTIVFIGYSLNDYNINLHLNWVKRLQKKDYKMPFFIRTDFKPIDEIQHSYYEKKGLRIIDAATIEETKEDEYEKRFSIIMDLLLESRENERLFNDESVVDFIYQKLTPLYKLQRIRKLDLNKVFDSDYYFEFDGIVMPYTTKSIGYMERFFELKNDKDHLSDEYKQKLETIEKFFEKNGILCMLKDAAGKCIDISCDIYNLAYHNDYDKMNDIIEAIYDEPELNYRKAFYLAYMGKLEESYKLYSDIIFEVMKDLPNKSNWLIYYLSQINRNTLYRSIKQISKHYDTIGILTYRKQYKPFSGEFLERIDREMKNFNIDDLFFSMPPDFQDKYVILKILSDNRFLYDDTVKLFELTNKVRFEMSKGTYTLGGLTTDEQVYIRLIDNLCFLYENYLWFSSFSEFKQYVKNSLILQFEKAEYEQTRDIDEFGTFFPSRKSGFQIDYCDFINVVKSFKLEDLKYLERRCNINRFDNLNIDKIELFIVRIANEIIKQFSKNGMNIVFFDMFIDEAKSVFYFARYVKLSDEALTRIFDALLFYFPDIGADIGDRINWIERMTLKSGLPKAAIPLIEKFLLVIAEKYKESTSANLESLSESKNIGLLVKYFYKDYISEDISSYALKVNCEMKNLIDYFYRLLRILSPEAMSHIVNLKKIENIKDLHDGMEVGEIENVSEYEHIIFNFMDQRMSRFIASQKKGIKEGFRDHYVTNIAIWYFSGLLTDSKLKEYLGFHDEYDFFVAPDKFNYERFLPSWLKKYNDRILHMIAQNKHMRTHISEILKEYAKTTKDISYYEIYIKYFAKQGS